MSTGHDHQLAQLLPCPECGAPSGLRCFTWAGPTAFPCGARLEALRAPQPPVLVTTWIDQLEEAVR